jgi:hypothetical protein
MNRHALSAEMTEAAERWQEAMRELVAANQKAARELAKWGMVDEAVHFQREAESVQAELSEGFFGVAW